MKILFCASEAYPFCASGGLGDVIGSLPAALKKRRTNVRVMLPLYGDMKEEWRQKLKYITNFTVPVGWRNQYCGLFELTHNGVTHYFLDNEYYFKRKGLYGFYDDGERYAFFARAVLEALFHVDFAPDVIHAHDWQTALVPVYLNLYYRHLEKYMPIKSVFTIHNIQYQGKYGVEILEETVGISKKNAHVVEFDKIVNYMKGAIECADKVTTVSPTYAQEILDPWYSFGLDSFLKKKQYKLCGILNGIDVEVYNPETDTHLAQNYSVKNMKEKKFACKKELCDEFELSDASKPLIGMVTRLVAPKGLDLVQSVIDNLLDEGMQVIMLGSGDKKYENFFSELSERRKGVVGVQIGFIPELARKIYAGADIFLMPSKSEPCGLAQMVALRYGTIPIVRETGGLKDSIQDSGDGKGNGFTFQNFDEYDMQRACLRAKDGYYNKDGWSQLCKRAMGCDFSWSNSAKQYQAMYKEVVALW